MGGIPHYLKEVEAGKTATQNIDQICFSPQGLLRDEFMQLNPALFDRAENHMRIVRALANTWQGVSKEQADEFRLKTAIFKSATKTNKQVFFTLLTTFPIVPNEQSLSAVDIALDMNCLFEPF